MKALYNNGQDFTVSIYVKKYGKIYLPKVVYNAMIEEQEYTAVDVHTSENEIVIKPNNKGYFIISNNGTSRNSRSISLKRTEIERYGIKSGHYSCKVSEDKSIIVFLKNRGE